jgi:hypothetical protein
MNFCKKLGTNPFVISQLPHTGTPEQLNRLHIRNYLIHEFPSIHCSLNIWFTHFFYLTNKSIDLMVRGAYTKNQIAFNQKIIVGTWNHLTNWLNIWFEIYIYAIIKLLASIVPVSIFSFPIFYVQILTKTFPSDIK